MNIRTHALFRSFGAVISLSVCWVCHAELRTINAITNNANVVGLYFDVPVTLPAATNPANYELYTKAGAIGINSVTIQTNNQFVRLTLATNVGEFFYLSISNIVDLETNTHSGYTLGYLSDYGNSDIGTAGDPVASGGVFTGLRDTFDVTANGSGIGGTNDHCRFLSLQVVSNFDMAVKVTRLDQMANDSQAGLMARESLAAGSRSVATFLTPPGGTNEVQVSVRVTNNGVATSSGFQVGSPALASSNSWLRLTRTNNIFTAWHGANGIDWNVSGIMTQAFASILNIGMAVSSRFNGSNTTATLTDFGFVGARPGDGTLPTLSAAVTGGTNLALSWTRVPRDYAVQFSTNLTDWSLLLDTVFETGTNGTGRLMNLPLNLVYSQTYFRLTRVDRMIPDPPLALYTGLVLSLANGNVIASSDSTLCIYTVRDAIAQTALSGSPNKNISFSTAGSGASLDTVLKVRWLPNLTPACNDDSAGNMKSLQAFTTTSSRTNFSLVAAVKTNTPVTATSTIKVGITVY